MAKRVCITSSAELPIDELVVLRQGRVLASGPFIELLRKDGLRATVRIETADETIEVSADPEELGRTMAALSRRKASIVRITTRGASLTDLYARLHRDESPI